MTDKKASLPEGKVRSVLIDGKTIVLKNQTPRNYINHIHIPWDLLNPHVRPGSPKFIIEEYPSEVDSRRNPGLSPPGSRTVDDPITFDGIPPKRYRKHVRPGFPEF